jgi:hypothetical protein
MEHLVAPAAAEITVDRVVPEQLVKETQGAMQPEANLDVVVVAQAGLEQQDLLRPGV